MQIQARVSFKMNPELVMMAGEQGLTETLTSFRDFVVTEAKKNVAPGRGPGPHPHISEHEDTGALQRAVFGEVIIRKWERDVSASRMTVKVGNYPPVPGKINYGIVLETGSRKMPPYPWLSPAFHAGRMRFGEFMSKGRSAMMSGTWKLSNFAMQKASISYPATGYTKMWPSVPGF